MKSLITSKYKHLLYRDECGDQFILTKHGEFYVYGEDKIGFNLISSKIAKELDSDCWYLDGDRLYQGIISNLDFQEYLKTIKQKWRLYKNGNRIKFWENRLAHKILRYKPIVFYPESITCSL